MTASAETRPKLGAGEQFADEAFALQALPRRSDGAHKWGVGGLVIVAGGPNFIGAAALAAMAAGRAGAGIINVAIPRAAMGSVAALVPEAGFIPLSEGDLDSSARRAREAIGAKLERSKAAVVGPGLGQDEYVDALLGAILGKRNARKASSLGFGVQKREGNEPPVANGEPALIGGEKPAVVDADGLNWLAKQPEWWTTVAPRSLVLTPHVGEMEKLTGKTSEEILADPRAAASAAAKQWNQIVVLKGGHSVVADGNRSLVAEDAPLSLATAGTGDVFAGMIGAFLAQGVAPVEAAGLAIYLGSRAARRMERVFGVLGVVASDLPAAAAAEIAELERKRDGNRG